VSEQTVQTLANVLAECWLTLHCPVDHDESGFSLIPYTFHPTIDRWDRRSVAFDGITKQALQGPPFLSSIPLLRMRFKIKFMERVQEVMGAQSTIANGQPMTRSYVQAQLSSSHPAVHFAETSQQGRVKQTYPYTPLAMNRQPQDSADLDPRWNDTAEGFRPMRNVAPHLTFGVLSMLGNHLVRTHGLTVCVVG
jgi:hypothetical protein